MRDEKVIVVGGGPAGLVCAMQLARESIPALVVERGRPGGQIRVARSVENMPGFEVGGAGEKIADAIVEHALANGVRIECDEILEIERTRSDAYILQSREQTYRAGVVVLAVGLRPVSLEAPPEAAPWIRTSWDQVAELENEHERLLVIGGGDVAFDQAIRWRERGWSVLLLHRSERLRALDKLVCVAGEVGVSTLQGTATRFEPDPPLLGVTIETDRGPIHEKFRWVLPCIGKRPFPLPVRQDGEPVELQPDRTGLTQLGDLYVIGDRLHPRHRHVTIAMGDGMTAACEIAGKLVCA